MCAMMINRVSDGDSWLDNLWVDDLWLDMMIFILYLNSFSYLLLVVIAANSIDFSPSLWALGA